MDATCVFSAAGALAGLLSVAWLAYELPGAPYGR